MKRRVLVLTPLLLACGPFFYQAPPPLESYPPRIPGKGWRDLFAEVKPAAPDAATSQQLIAACEALVAELPALAPAARLEKIDALLAGNRDGDFRLRPANFLHELREFCADDAALAAAGPYLKWRLGRLALPAGFILRAPVRRWDLDGVDFDKAVAEYESGWTSASTWLDQALLAEPPAFRPNLMVQKGALAMEYGKTDEARAIFADAIAAYPDHPRTGAARLMLGRCFLQLARMEARKPADPQDGDALIRSLLDESRDELQRCLDADPRGRFAADAWGWLAAVAMERKNRSEAVRCQLQRLDLQPTREVTRSVLRECDRIFADFFEGANHPGEHFDLDAIERYLPFDAMAKHPAIARLFVRQALDPAAGEALPAAPEDSGSDRHTIDFLHRRIIRPQPLAKRALAELGKAIVREIGVARPDPFTLLVLGWSSYREGESQQALALFDQAIAQLRNDELLQGRALALTALGLHREAAETHAALAKEFPDSRITRDSVFEHALSRYHAGEAGEALLMMLGLRSDDSDIPATPVHPEHEPVQWIDSIAQFAPLDQLAAPLARLPENDPQAKLLRAIVRTRALCAENFALARRHLDPPDEAAVADDSGFAELPRGIGLTAALWQQEVESLAGATELLADAPESAKASRHLQIGRRWKDLRGRLTLPLHQLFDYSQSEGEKLEQLRRKNAAFLGLTPDAVTAELDSRDELHHALRHFLAAAESPNPDVAAPALEEANEALFRLAEFSLYRCSRAVETDASGLSRKLVGRLRSDFPDLREAARAVTLSFTPPVLLGTWMPGDYTPGNSAFALASAVMDPRSGRWREWEPHPGDAEGARLRQEFASFAIDPAEDLPQLKQRLSGLRAEFDRARPMLDESDILALVDDLDDLAAAVEAPGITADLFRRYAAIRRAKSPPPPAAGEWAPLAPWLAFLDRIRSIQLPDGSTSSTGDSVAAWERFLAEFPEGPKSEAASLRLLRKKVRAVCPIPQVEAFHFPEAPIPGGYKRLTAMPALDRGTAAPLLESLDAHEARHPGGRYRADLRLLRAAVASASKDYPAAIQCLADVLADPAHPELRMNAALQLAELGLRLLDRNERPALAAAFRAEQEIMPYLKNLVHGDTCLFRLRPLMGWLEAQ